MGRPRIHPKIETELSKTIEERLRNVVKKRGRTIKEVEQSSELRAQSLTTLLARRKVNPTVERLKLLADELGVTVGYLVGEHDELDMTAPTQKLKIIRDLLNDP